MNSHDMRVRVRVRVRGSQEHSNTVKLYLKTLLEAHVDVGQKRLTYQMLLAVYRQNLLLLIWVWLFLNTVKNAFFGLLWHERPDVQINESLFEEIISLIAMGAPKTGMDSGFTVNGFKQAMPREAQIRRNCNALIVSKAEQPILVPKELKCLSESNNWVKKETSARRAEVIFLVEPSGIEPLTSTLPVLRSPS